MTSLSRRAFLTTAAGAAGVSVLAACGGGSSSGQKAAVTLRYQPDGNLIPGTQRIVLGLGDKEKVPLKTGPAKLDAVLSTLDGSQLATITGVRHEAGLPRAYYLFETKLDKAGTYTLKLKVPGSKLDPYAFTVVTPGPDHTPVPNPGDKLIAVDTPTTTDAHGVSPYCTADPPCPLHEVTLTDALKEGKPIALLIGTPAYCQTGICGPVLDLLVAEHKVRGDAVRMIHAEVYTKPYAADVPASPAVDAYKLDFEPVLFLAGADGVIRQRLDVIYDSAELKARLDALVA